MGSSVVVGAEKVLVFLNKRKMQHQIEQYYRMRGRQLKEKSINVPSWLGLTLVILLGAAFIALLIFNI
jgi:hypothetical protein